VKVLVTGGTGFIGSHLVEQLIGEGHDVRCLVRDPARPGWLAGREVELVQGDCTVPDSLARAVAGVRRVYHLAGVTFARNFEAYFQHNAGGTLNLLRACADLGLDRFVLVSSHAAAGPGQSVTEIDSPRPLTAYGASKLAAEYHVHQAAGRLPTVILRPSAVYGPRDRAFLEYFRLAKRGILIEFAPKQRTVSLSHVRDLVSGIVLVADGQVRSGSAYFLADPRPYDWREVEETVCASLGIHARRLRVPGVIVGIASRLANGYAAITGKEAVLNAERVAELMEPNWVCDVSRIQDELGFAPKTTLKQGLFETLRWYEQQGWL